MLETNILHTFIIKAKKATYVGGGESSESSRAGSHDLIFEDGAWAYRDSYFGGTDFLGQETVWHHGEPVWAMNYYGYILRPDLITSTQAGNILKKALSSPTSQGRLLDKLSLTEEQFTYTITSEGDVQHFRGRETIGVGSTTVYALDFHGGQIKS